MAEYYQQGEAIEGDKVSGTSRKPLIWRGPATFRGMRCIRWTAQFNVTSKIDAVCKDGAQFEGEAARDLGASLKCDRATIHSMDGKPSKQVAPGSGTHQTNAWRFSGATNVIVEHPHQELVDGARKRALAERKLP